MTAVTWVERTEQLSVAMKGWWWDQPRAQRKAFQKARLKDQRRGLRLAVQMESSKARRMVDLRALQMVFQKDSWKAQC